MITDDQGMFFMSNEPEHAIARTEMNIYKASCYINTRIL